MRTLLWLMFSAVIGVAVSTVTGCDLPLPKKKPKSAETTPTIDDRNTNYRSGDSTLRNSLRAGQRAGLMVEMDQIGKMISQTVILDDRMPSAAEITKDVQQQSGKLAGLIADGTIILTDTTDKRGLWAYEVDSDKAGGLVLVGGTVSRATADDVKALIARK